MKAAMLILCMTAPCSFAVRTPGWVVVCGVTEDGAEASDEADLLDALGYDGDTLWIPNWPSLQQSEQWLVYAGGMASPREAAVTASELLWHFPGAHGEIVHDGFSRRAGVPMPSEMIDLIGLCPPVQDFMYSVSLPSSWEYSVETLGDSSLEEWERPVHIRQELPGWRLEKWEDIYAGAIEFRAYRAADPENAGLFAGIRLYLRESAPLMKAEIVESPGEYILLHRYPDSGDRYGDTDFWAVLSGDSIEYGYSCRLFFGEMPDSWMSLPAGARPSLIPETCVNLQEAIGLLVERLEADGAFPPPFPELVSFGLEPMDGFQEDAWRGYYDIALREVHPVCSPGDPTTAPVIERFRVYARAGEIIWFSMPEGRWAPCRDFLESRSGPE
jgi:hypothetical protein